MITLPVLSNWGSYVGRRLGEILLGSLIVLFTTFKYLAIYYVDPFILLPPGLQRFRMGQMAASHVLSLLCPGCAGCRGLSQLFCSAAPQGYSVTASRAPGPLLLILSRGAKTLLVERLFGKLTCSRVVFSVIISQSWTQAVLHVLLYLKGILSEIPLCFYIETSQDSDKSSRDRRQIPMTEY